jgi:integrating conjugative element relaxase (TIGR03760 family)
VLDFLLLLALLLLSIAIWLQLQPVASRVWLQFKTIQPQFASAPLKSAAAATHPTLKDHKGSLPSHLAVLNHRELLQITGAHRLLPHLSQLSCLSQATFDRDLLPVIERYAEFVQLMPASESHHHANVGGLLVHAMECAHHALVRRRGYVLPRSGGAEIQDEQRDHWTYAVFLGALLHDVGKPLSDLRISMRLTQAGQATRWMPMSGSLVDCKALEYAVQFAPKAERDYTAHGRMGMVLLQRLVPASTLRFLGQHPNVLEELTQFLSGDTGQGGLAELVSQADQRSTKANLATGDRSRFASARSIPLVEQLMNALQAMLARGGQLPLNRDGAAGWVSQGSVWFVAKHLADEVRQYILAHAGEDAGIPGKDKNDRLCSTAGRNMGKSCPIR